MSRVGHQSSRLMSMEQRDTRHQLHEETLQVWQPRSDGRLTKEDTREIAANMTGFFRLLSEWDRVARREDAGGTITDAVAGGRSE